MVPTQYTHNNGYNVFLDFGSLLLKSGTPKCCTELLFLADEESQNPVFKNSLMNLPILKDPDEMQHSVDDLCKQFGPDLDPNCLTH